MALLGNSWDDPQSQAIMALAGGLLQGNFGRGATDYAQVLAGAKDRELKRKMIELQMQGMQSDMEMKGDAATRAKQLRELAGRFQTPATQGRGATGAINGLLPPELQMSAQPAIPGQPARFDYEGYAKALAGIDPIAALELEQRIKPTRKLMKLGAGDTLVDEADPSKPLFSAPQKPESMPSAVREYEYAKDQGYQGTFEQWDTARKRAGASSVSVNTGQRGFDNTLKLRGDFRSEPIYKAHQEVQSAYSQIQQGLKMASPAGDLAGATKIMKLLDPGSVVRESELGMAMAATGAMDRLENYAANIMKGTKLTPSQRKDFQALADRLYGESVKQYNAKRSEYQGIAQRNQLNEADILGPQAQPAKNDGWGITRVP